MAVLVLTSGSHCEADFVSAEVSRWKRIKGELEVVANTLRNSPGLMVDSEGSDLLSSLQLYLSDHLSDVTGRIEALEAAE